MRITIFRKYLLGTSCIMLFSFLVMGIVLFVSISNYWVEDRLESLRKTAVFSSNVASSQIVRSEKFSYELGSDTQYLFMLQNQALGADFFLTKANGEIVISSEPKDSKLIGKTVPKDIVKSAMEQEYSGVSDLDGLYPEKQYIVGVPLVYLPDDGKSEDSMVIGAVFVTSTAHSISAFRRDIVQICIISAIFASAISFLLAGAITYRMVLPLREMRAAAASFAKGDFSQRLRVRSRDEVGELAEMLNNMASALAASETMNRSFIANVSHELKTPMTTISGFVDGVLDGTIPPDRQDYYLRIVSSEVRRLSRLVQSMLALSRIDSGKMKLHRVKFDLLDTIVDTMLSFESLIDGRNIHVVGLEDCDSTFVEGDPDLIHQVVYNLVENAVKFVDEGGTISVSVTQDAQNARVRIRNSGSGISPEDLPRIFDRFYKTDKSRSHDKNGMGLGLYLVRTIIQMHGGTISVNSVEGAYCEFEFHLPLQAPILAEEI